MVKLMDSKGVIVDYKTLLTDLWFWGDEDSKTFGDRTKNKWISDFYSIPV
jgi:CRISPR type I-E-associated protein CasB/Cse2